MAEAHWFRHSLRIGVVEYQRAVRSLRESTVRFAFICGGIVVMTLASLGFSILFAVILRPSAGSITIHSTNRGYFGMFWLFEAYMVGHRVIAQRSRIDSEEIALTTVSARTVASGLIVADVLRVASYIVFPTIIITGSIVYIFHAPVSALFIPIAVILFLVSSILVGHAGGYLGALLLVRSRFVARYKTVIGTVLVLVIMGGYLLLLSGPIYGLGNYRGVLAWLPISWYIDLAVVGSPVSQSWANVAGVFGTTIVIIIGGGYAIERITTALWLDDPVEVGDGETTPTVPSTDRNALTSALRPVWLPSGLDTPTRRVAQTTLVRTWRNPSKLSFIMLPVFIAGGLLVSVARMGLVAEIAPVVAAIAVPWIAGAAFGLNPLGDERRVLPTTLTTSITGEQFVQGITIPGRIVGLPATIVLTMGVGVVSPYSLLERTGLLAVGVMLLFMSVQLAPLIGMWFPRFSAIDVRQSREVVPPSFTAIVIHSLITAGLGLIAIASLLEPESVQTVFQLFVGGGIPTVWIRIGGFGLPLVLAVAITDRSLRYASNRFETYTLD